MLSLRVSLDDTDAGRDPIAGARKRTIENDAGHADSARDGMDGTTRWHGGKCHAGQLTTRMETARAGGQCREAKGGEASGGTGRESRRIALSD
jgi:hypothetical protein